MSDAKITAMPEKIIFVNGLTNEVRTEKNFAEVPESIRFAPNARGENEPVVKIVDITTDTQRIIKQFGRDNVELRSTIQFLQK